jgi:ATP-dependent RNA helicase RhlE
MNFASLGLAPELLHAIKKCGYQQLTPVQEQTIPQGRRARDLLVTAQTGTGKTAAYGISILQQMAERPRAARSGYVRALILAPTRELAEQVAQNLTQYSEMLNLSVGVIYGGVKHTSQAAKLAAGLDILVATPGRLLEHVELGNLNLELTEFLVLDEADRMLDMGFVGEISKLLATMGKKPQVMFFSATLTSQVNILAKDILVRPQVIAVSKRNTVADTVEHVLYPVDQARKYELFRELLRSQNWYQVMAFSSTREEADRLISALKEDKVDAAVIHSEKTQGARRRALQEFKDGKLQVLVATEVAARGLDIQGLDYVVNLDLPFFTEDYVHRVGRTGRAGKKGMAISFVSPADENKVAAIEKVIGTKITRVKQKGFEVTESAPASARPTTQFAKAISHTAKVKSQARGKTSDGKAKPASRPARANASKGKSIGPTASSGRPIAKPKPSGGSKRGR